MSGLRDLVAGSDGCSAGASTSGGAGGANNAVGALVNQLLGGAGKTQEQLRDLPQGGGAHLPGRMGGAPMPGAVALTPEAAAAAGPGGLVAARARQAMGSVVGRPPPGAAAADVEAFMRHQHHQQMMMMRSGAGAAAPPGAVPASAAGPSAAFNIDEFEQFEKGFRPMPGPPHLQHQQHHPVPPEALAAMHPQLRAFLRNEPPGAAANLPPPPHHLVPPEEQMRLRDRATVVARHMHGLAGPAAADEQVARLMASMHLEAGAAGAMRAGVLPPPQMGPSPAEWDELWRRQQHGMGGPPGPMMMMRPPLHQVHRPPSTGWADEFAVAQQEQRRRREQQEQEQMQGAAASQGPAQGWADEFAASAQQQPAQQPQTWAAEFEQQQQQQAGTTTTTTTTSAGDATAQEHAARLASVLSRDADPRMQRSQFLRFLSQVGRGELAVDEQGNRVVEAVPGAAATARAAATGPEPQLWADEFAAQATGPPRQQQQPRNGGDWADEFARGFEDLGLARGEEADEAARAAFGDDPALEAAWRQQLGGRQQQRQPGAPPPPPPNAWASEFAQQQQAHHHHHQPQQQQQHHDPYTFAPQQQNPFAADPSSAFAKGQDLFRRGLLTEAVLALEAEVASHPDHGAAWRLLGEAHAENDDDRQAIAALRKALEVDPLDAEAFLALGVSHTNELDEGEAVAYLWRWLEVHPKHASAAAAERRAHPNADSSQAVASAARALALAARQSPDDPQPLLALGVVRHLSRDYAGAVAAFKSALELTPENHSLWNKLGATLANHGHSRDAAQAYQRALDLKPSYMRAWTNLGISFANVGDYEAAARHYVRALSLNPLAAHVWGYLRTSLACAGRGDLAEAADREDLAVLGRALPLDGGEVGGGGLAPQVGGGMGQAFAFDPTAELEEAWGAAAANGNGNGAAGP